MDKLVDISKSNNIFIHVNFGVILLKKLVELSQKIEGLSENLTAE